jgi:hypothetical protein|tara:strand:+ start:161 stop:1201 length:1041 start_codon:yes stop_codon:yes gene_type:complete
MSIDNVQSEFSGSVDDTAEAILASWEDADEDQLSEKSALEATDESTSEQETDDVDESDETELDEETEEDESETEEDPQEEDSETKEEAEEETEEVSLSDDTLVELLVDGETKQASLKDLKRLYGQEASLTRKSQETANQKKEANEAMQRADASLQAMLSRAQERFKPYSEVDMLVASRQMNPDDFAALRAEAKLAEGDLKFLTEEANSFYGELQNKQAEQQRESAKNCIEVLQKELPEWSTELYNDIRQHAITSGLPAESVNQYTDPNVIMLLHKAMMFDKSKQVAKSKKAKAPAKVLRSKKAPPNKTDQRISKQKAAQEKLRKSPSGGNDLDDIAEMLMANWDVE